MSDPVLDVFHRLGEEARYPGSKQIRRGLLENHKSRTQPDDEAWDARPVVLLVDGVETDFFTVGQLGKAMNDRGPDVIRKWQRLGYIPEPNFRTPARHRNGARRLYTREQVETLVRIAREEGVYDGVESIRATRFPQRAAEVFA